MKSFGQIAINAIFANQPLYFSWSRKNSIPSPRILDFSDTRYHLVEIFCPALSPRKCTIHKVPDARSLTTEEWLDSVEAAAYLKVTLGALRNMTSNGRVPFYKVGKRNRYRTEELRKLLLSQKRGASYGN